MVRLDYPLVTGTPVWGDVARPSPLAPLRGTHPADVVIVGAGFSGLALALELARKGLAPVVLEADRVGAGSTPASTAQLLWETDRDLHLLEDEEGRARAVAVWRSCFEALDWWAECCRTSRLGGFERATSVYFAEDAAQREVLLREAGARRDAGLPSRFVDDPAPWLGFHAPGAIVSEGAAAADPARLLGDLLRACLDAGVRVHEDTPVTEVRGDRVRGPGFEVRARRVVVAAGLRGLQDFRLPPWVRQRATFVLALDAAPRAWRRDAIGWSAARPYTYLRRTDAFALIGGEDLPAARARAEGDAPFARLRARWDALHPAERGAPERARWSGLFPNSADSLPIIGPLAQLGGADALLAFGGNGLVFSLVGAWLLGRALAGEDMTEELAPYRPVAMHGH